jgi:hypothetical protein
MIESEGKMKTDREILDPVKGESWHYSTATRTIFLNNANGTKTRLLDLRPALDVYGESIAHFNPEKIGRMLDEMDSLRRTVCYLEAQIGFSNGDMEKIAKNRLYDDAFRCHVCGAKLDGLGNGHLDDCSWLPTWQRRYL